MRKFVILAAALAGLCAGPAAVAASPPYPVVMSGLNNPRGLAFAANGALYVAEAGVGGSEPCFSVRGSTVLAGRTGSVSRLRNGVQTRVAQGLPSYSEGPGGVATTGPHDVTFVGSNAEVSIGLGAAPTARFACALGLQFGRLARFPAGGGSWYPFADLAWHEQLRNPDGGILESNPYGLLGLGGTTVATDAGGNSLLQVSPFGSIQTLAVFPSRSTGRNTDSVPTSVVVGPDGAYYVGELTGVPFAQGAANVYRVVPGQAPTVFAGGFTAIIDIAFGSDGSLYVLEHATQTGLNGPGALIRVAPGGARSTIATGLVKPTSVAIGADGAFYVSNCGIFPGSGPFPCNGQVVRIVP